jgi:hypothetical protein
MVVVSIFGHGGDVLELKARALYKVRSVGSQLFDNTKLNFMISMLGATIVSYL